MPSIKSRIAVQSALVAAAIGVFSVPANNMLEQRVFTENQIYLQRPADYTAPPKIESHGNIDLYFFGENSNWENHSGKKNELIDSMEFDKVVFYTRDGKLVARFSRISHDKGMIELEDSNSYIGLWTQESVEKIIDDALKSKAKTGIQKK